MIKCRVAKGEDLNAILKLYERTLDEGEAVSLKKATRIFERAEANAYYDFYVAELHNKIVGTFALMMMENMAHQCTPSAIVESVAVDPDHQGQGIGRAMMEHAIELAREGGCYKLTLSANKKREASHKFYESLGFKQHGLSFLVEL